MKIITNFAGILFVIALFSCNDQKVRMANENEIVVYGQLTNGEDKSVSMEEMLTQSTQVVAEGKVDNEGNFYFKTEVDEVKILYFKTANGQFVTLMANPGETIELNGDYVNLSQTYNIKGSPQTSLLIEINEAKIPYTRMLDSLNSVWIEKRGDDDKMQVREHLDSAVNEIVGDYKGEMTNFIAENDSSLLSLFAYYQSFGKRKVFEEEKDSALFRKIVQSLVAKYPDNFHSIENYKRYLKMREKSSPRIYGNKVGESFPKVLITEQEDDGVFPSDHYGRSVLYCFYDEKSDDKKLKQIYEDNHKSGLRIIVIHETRPIEINMKNYILLEGSFAADEKKPKELFGQEDYPFYVLVNRDGNIMAINSDLEFIQY